MKNHIGLVWSEGGSIGVWCHGVWCQAPLWVFGVRHHCQAHDTTAGIGGIYGLREAAFRRVQVSFGADARDMPAYGFFHPLSMMQVAQSAFLA